MPREVMEAAPAFRAFDVLNGAAAAGRAADEDDQPALDRSRMWLQGSLDLHVPLAALHRIARLAPPGVDASQLIPRARTTRL